MQRLPLAGNDELAEAGGLIGYGADFLAMCRRAAVFVSTILKGGKPASIPVEQATKFALVINLKTAKDARPHHALGLAERRRQGDRIGETNVRYWHKADMPLLHRTCPLLGVKRTSLFVAHMSACDPKRTFAGSRLASKRVRLSGSIED